MKKMLFSFLFFSFFFYLFEKKDQYFYDKMPKNIEKTSWVKFFRKKRFYAIIVKITILNYLECFIIFYDMKNKQIYSHISIIP